MNSRRYLAPTALAVLMLAHGAAHAEADDAPISIQTIDRELATFAGESGVTKDLTDKLCPASLEQLEEIANSTGARLVEHTTGAVGSKPGDVTLQYTYNRWPFSNISFWLVLNETAEECFAMARFNTL